MAYGFGQLREDFRKALAMPPSEALRRFAGRARGCALRLRQRRARPLSEAEFLRALAAPVESLAQFIEQRASRPPLVAAATSAADLARRVEALDPGCLAPIVASARAVREGTFDLLGSGPRRLGASPDWQLDFKSGKRWKASQIAFDILPEPDQGHDIKVPWELARLQDLPTLGIAAAIGDTGMRSAAVAQVASFLENNPICRGVNWSCTMDVAIRAVQLLAAEGFLRGAGEPSFWSRYYRSLLEHGRFIREHLEDGPLRGNHFLADVAGLYLCGLALPELSEAFRWRLEGRGFLLGEMQEQVHPDGWDFEASTSYHAFATEMLLFPALLGAHRGDDFPQAYLARLEKMLAALAMVMRPDGTLPQIGDNDDGRFLILSQYHRHRRDWRPLLALGSWLFRNPSWLQLSGDAWVEGVFVLGEEFLAWAAAAQEAARNPHRFASRAFPESGYFQLANGSIQMLVDAGGVGQKGNGGHAHNDTLAFELHAFGREILVDRGTGCYTPSLATRNRFRATRAHNTVQVDVQEINPIPVGAFTLASADEPAVSRWRAGASFTYFSASHGGYLRLSEPLLHRRSILFRHEKGEFDLEDRFLGGGWHRFEAGFHLPPGWSASGDAEGWTALDANHEAGIRFTWLRSPQEVATRVESDEHSPSYGVLLPSQVVRIAWNGTAPQRIRYRLKPFLQGGGA